MHRLTSLFDGNINDYRSPLSSHYSSDLALCDFGRFPKMKLQLKYRRFDSIEIIEEDSQVVLNSFTKNEISARTDKNAWSGP